MSLEWRVIEPSLRSGAEIVAIDDVLHEYVGKQKSPPTVIFYHWNNVMSIGKPQALSDVNLEKCKLYNVEVVRTTGGGRAVLHLGYQDVSYSVVAPANGRGFDIIYEEFCGKIAQALQALKIPVEIRARNDCYVGGRKISGNAMRLDKGAVTQHGIILYKQHPAALTISLMNPDMYSINDVTELQARLTAVTEKNPEVTMRQLVDTLREHLTNGNFYQDDLSTAEKGEIARRKKTYEDVNWFKGDSSRGLCWLSKGEPRGSLQGY
ncbi:MAG: hypothetical protein AABW64_01335 [Nanoarchaeota archaeon]